MLLTWWGYLQSFGGGFHKVGLGTFLFCLALATSNLFQQTCCFEKSRRINKKPWAKHVVSSASRLVRLPPVPWWWIHQVGSGTLGVHPLFLITAFHFWWVYFFLALIDCAKITVLPAFGPPTPYGCFLSTNLLLWQIARINKKNPVASHLVGLPPVPSHPPKKRHGDAIGATSVKLLLVQEATV